MALQSASRRRSLFSSWKRSHGRSYRDGSAEDNRRYKAWSANLDDLVCWNQRHNDAAADVAAVGHPDEYDMREHALVPPVRDQRDCGSCYAFAALAAIEIKARRDGTEPGPDLSEQQMLDCLGPSCGYQSLGCRGGYLEDVFSYVSAERSARQVAYPYTGRPGANCRTKNASSAGALTLKPPPGYAQVAGTPAALMNAVYNRGAVAVYFYATQDFFALYDGGVYPASACARANPGDAINHAMVRF
ncbi:hypothetical protein ABPG75_004135 [Micractinium tetrahymenae]